VGFHGKGTPNGDSLHFVYTWASSTGNLADLSNCMVSQRVTYPSSPFLYPPPYAPGFLSRSPLVTGVAASLGIAQDNHGHPPIVPPYAPGNTFTASQEYFYTCPCVTGEVQLQTQPITRTISQRPDGNWKYTITKSGVTAGIDPLP